MATILMSVVWSIPTAVKMIAILTLVYGILQIVKKSPLIGPYITGWMAVALNLILNTLGAIIVIPSDQLYTTDSILVILTAALGSAGIHGTVSKLTNPKQPVAETESTAAK